MRRTIRHADPSLFDYQNHVERLAQRPTSLDALFAFIDWEQFRPTLERCFPKIDPRKGGRPSFDVIFMFQVLVLQRIHNCSDAETELAIQDRLSWQRVLGIHLGCRMPDRNTIWDFREALTRADAFVSCFGLFFGQIESNGYNLESGSVVDASLVEVPVQRNTREENEQLKDGDVPAEWSDVKHAQKDTDAAWTKKRGVNYFGYKNHIKIDQQTKIIMACCITAANVHDSQVLFDLLDENDRRLYADSAYRSEAINARLREMGVQDWTNEKGHRGRPLSDDRKDKNRTKSHIRSRVEHVFGWIETSFNGMNQRVIGWKRNVSQIIMTNLIFNMDRLRCIASNP